MTMKEKLTQEIIKAMKDKDTLKKSFLQLIKSSVENLEIKNKKSLTKKEEIQIIQREVKQTKEALADAQKYNRQDLVEANERKLDILKDYLPAQLTEEEVREVCLQAGVTPGMNMGEAMKLVMPKLSGKTENALISKTVKDLIAWVDCLKKSS